MRRSMDHGAYHVPLCRRARPHAPRHAHTLVSAIGYVAIIALVVSAGLALASARPAATRLRASPSISLRPAAGQRAARPFGIGGTGRRAPVPRSGLPLPAVRAAAVKGPPAPSVPVEQYSAGGLGQDGAAWPFRARALGWGVLAWGVGLVPIALLVRWWGHRHARGLRRRWAFELGAVAVDVPGTCMSRAAPAPPHRLRAMRLYSAASDDVEGDGADAPPRKKKKKKRPRPFDLSRHRKRYVALRIAYLGDNYRGLAIQVNTDQTVEEELFRALEKTCLIADRSSIRYSRCGRTDKGVSALDQVVALNLRSALREGVEFVPEAPPAASPSPSPSPAARTPHPEPPDPATPRQAADLDPAAAAASAAQELDYVGMLNGVLPPDIRVLAWAPVPERFSARFSCTGRTYKYFFMKRDLDIGRMRAGAAHLVGEHDFRNFCKMDVVTTSNFVRNILSFEIEPVSPAQDAASPLSVWVATIDGTAFLYHQVRCMMQVLFDVGVGDEDPEVVPWLLDVEAHPRKPRYEPATEVGLVLWDCRFDGVEWSSTVRAQRRIMTRLLETYEERVVKASMLEAMQGAVDRLRFASLLDDDDAVLTDVVAQGLPGVWAAKRKYPRRAHIRMADKDTELSYDERVEALSQSKTRRRQTNVDKGLLKPAAGDRPARRVTAYAADAVEPEGPGLAVPET